MGKTGRYGGFVNSFFVYNNTLFLEKINKMKNKFLSLVLLFLFVVSTNLFSQSSAGTNKDDVYTSAEVMPQFPGGAMALYDYFKSNLKYPDAAREKGTEGVVITSFVIDAEGNLKNPVVIKSHDALLDAEALRIVSTMPKWKPGMQGGKNVPVQLSLPVRFTLTVPDEKNKKKK